MLTAQTIVNKPMLMYPYPAIDAGHKVSMAILAELFFKLRRKPYFILHCDSSC